MAIPPLVQLSAMMCGVRYVARAQNTIADPSFYQHGWVRWQVLGALFLLSFITIVDRVCISAAKPEMASALKISDMTFGVVFGAFALGYAVFMIPSGWSASRSNEFLPRRFLTSIVLAWSGFTILTGLASATAMLIAIRFLFGAAEAGAFPTAARAIYDWLPRGERGVALGILNSGSRLGAAAGLALMSVSTATLGWRASFQVLGCLGCAWAAWWLWWYRDDPEQKPGISRGEVNWIREADSLCRPGGPLAAARSLFSTSTAFLTLQYFGSNFTFFLCFSWLLPYLRSHFQLGSREAGIYASLPLYCGALATWTGGLAVDAIFRRGHWNLSRRLPAMLGFVLASIGLCVAVKVSSLPAFLVCFSIATFGVDFTLSPSWSAAADLGGARTGTLSSAMNMVGSAGSFASSVIPVVTS